MVTLGRLLMHAGWTLAFPGVGQGAAGKRVLAYALAVAGVVAALAVTVTVFALYVAIVLRLGATIDAVLRLRRVEIEAEDRNAPLHASVIGVLGFLYFMFATERYAIPTPSMEPTIAVGDTVYVEKWTLLWSMPSRGDVIVFDHPCEKRTHIKRVVGVAGDSIEVRCGKLYVNGEAASRDGDLETSGSRIYRVRPGGPDFPGEVLRACPGKTDQRVGHVIPRGGTASRCEQQAAYMVPEMSVFVLGDNRAESNDSRNWGVVPLMNVTGYAVGVAWPLSHVGDVW